MADASPSHSGHPLQPISGPAPEVLFIASGSAPEVPPNMIDIVMKVANIEIMMLDDLHEQRLDVGRDVRVIGGDQSRMLAADYVSEGGHSVRVAESSGRSRGRQRVSAGGWNDFQRENSQRTGIVANAIAGVTRGSRDSLHEQATKCWCRSRRRRRWSPCPDQLPMYRASGCSGHSGPFA